MGETDSDVKTPVGGMEALMQTALHDYHEGRFPQAVSNWEKVLSADPHHQTAKDFLKYVKNNLKALKAHAAGMDVPVPLPPPGLSKGRTETSVPPTLEIEALPADDAAPRKAKAARPIESGMFQVADPQPMPQTTIPGMRFKVPTVEIDALPADEERPEESSSGSVPVGGVEFGPPTGQFETSSQPLAETEGPSTVEIEALPAEDEQVAEPALFEEEELKVLSADSQGGTPIDPNAIPLPPPPEKADEPSEVVLESSDEADAEASDETPGATKAEPLEQPQTDVDADSGVVVSPPASYADDAPTLARSADARPAAAFERAVAPSKSPTQELVTGVIDTARPEQTSEQARPSSTLKGVMPSDDLTAEPRAAGQAGQEFADDDPTMERDTWKRPYQPILDMEAQAREDPEGGLAKARELFEAGEHSRSLRMAAAVAAALGDDPRVASLIEQNTEILTSTFLAKLGSLDDVPSMSEAPPAVERLDLDHREVFLLSRIDGQLTVDEILMVSGMPRLEALHTLVRLRDLGLITVTPPEQD